ncbi:hypothetical protein GCM10027596_24880 [Nocardioides korecus]
MWVPDAHWNRWHALEDRGLQTEEGSVLPCSRCAWQNGSLERRSAREPERGQVAKETGQ